jgi:regulator of sigma E protease
VLFVIAFTAGVRFESPIVGEVEPGSPAALAEAVDPPEGYADTVGLRPGDRILSIDGSIANTFGDVQIATAMGRLDRAHDIRVQRDGVAEPLQYSIIPVKNEASGLLGIGVWPGHSLQLAVEPDLAFIVDGELQRLGLLDQGVRPGMTLESIDGAPVWNWEAFSSQSRDSGGRAMSTSWIRPEDTSGRVEHLEVDMVASPQWQQLMYPSASPAMSVAYEKGLFGLVPLVSIGTVPESSPNHGILEPGDLVLRIGDEQAPRMRTFRDTKNAHGAGVIPMLVLRNGERIEVDARIVDTGILDPKPLLGVTPEYGWTTPRLARPMEFVEGPADAAGFATTIPTPVSGLGILGGSLVVSVDGAAIESWDDIWRGVHAAVDAGHDSVTLVMESPTPGRERRSIDVPFDATWGQQAAALGWKAPLPFYCFEPLYTVRSSGGNPLRAVNMGLQETAKLVVLTYLTIDRLFRGTVGVEQLHGPVGIVHLGSKVADRGFTYLLFFLGLISVNLAVINFLPLPIVDGGLFLYLVYEKIKGRPPSVGFQNGAALIGLMLIATAFVVTFYNDILRLVG